MLVQKQEMCRLSSGWVPLRVTVPAVFAVAVSCRSSIPWFLQKWRLMHCCWWFQPLGRNMKKLCTVCLCSERWGSEQCGVSSQRKMPKGLPFLYERLHVFVLFGRLINDLSGWKLAKSRYPVTDWTRHCTMIHWFSQKASSDTLILTKSIIIIPTQFISAFNPQTTLSHWQSFHQTHHQAVRINTVITSRDHWMFIQSRIRYSLQDHRQQHFCRWH